MAAANLILLAHSRIVNTKRKTKLDSSVLWPSVFNWRDDKTNAREVLIFGR